MRAAKTSIISLIGLLFLLFNAHSVRPVFSANIYDLANSSNWNIRFDGETASDSLGGGGIAIGDLNNDGKQDLAIAVYQDDNNGRSNSGSVYVIYNELLTEFSKTGNIINLARPDNYNLRFDGAATGDYLMIMNGNHNQGTFADIDNDGKLDIILTAKADNRTRLDSGSTYIVFNSLLSKYTGTGNNIDLLNSLNYNLRFDGELAGDYLGTLVNTANINGNGRLDLIIAASFATRNSRSKAGSLYVIYDSIIQNFSGTGNNIDLATSTNYNLRYDGAKAGDYLSLNSSQAANLNGNDKLDLLIVAPFTGFNSLSASGSLYVIYDSLINSYSGTGNNIDLLTAGNYNLRYDGPNESAEFPYGVLEIADLDGNGKNDIIGGANFASNNSRIASGSLYVIYDTLLDDFSGTGRDLVLTNSSYYNLRFDGALAYDYLTDNGGQVGDFDNDGRLDIIVGARGTSPHDRAQAGSLYVIYNAIFGDYKNTGNNIDLADSNNFSIRFDGAEAGDWLSDAKLIAADINDDGKKDILTNAYTDINSIVNAGSVYLLYNYPHTIGTESIKHDDVQYNVLSELKGGISASDSTTDIKGLQIVINDSSFDSQHWKDCTPKDGDFNSKEEKYICKDIPVDLKEGTHYYYLRSWDNNNSYTAQDNYRKIQLDIDSHEPYLRDLILKKKEEKEKTGETLSEFINKDYLDNSYDDGTRFVYNVVDDKPKENKDKIWGVPRIIRPVSIIN